MGAIKSALELALERTADIKEDKESLRQKELREVGMKLLLKFETADDADFDLKKELGAFSKDDKAIVVEGLRKNLDPLLNLPANKDTLARFNKLARVFSILSTKPEMVEDYLSQLAEFFNKYLDNKSQLYEALVKQYEPQLRAKEEQVARQGGRRVRIQPEQDNDFNMIYQKNLENLQAQFSNALEQVREEVFSVIKV